MARDPQSLLIEDALKAFRIHFHNLSPNTLDGYEIFIRKYASWLETGTLPEPKRTKKGEDTGPTLPARADALVEALAESRSGPGAPSKPTGSQPGAGRLRDERLGRASVVANIELGLVNAWIADIRKGTSPQTGKPYSGSSQLQAWAAIRKFALFVAAQYKHRDPETGGSVLAHLQMPVVGDDSRRELSDAELWRVLEAAKIGRNGPRNYAIVYSDAGLGLRRGELIGFKIRQIDWEQRCVLVRRTTSKGRSYERKITMGPEVTNVLHHWIYDEREGDPYNEEGEVFLLEDGRPMTKSAINRMARSIKVGSGVKRFSLHLGRHTWATNFRRAGSGDLLELQRQGGWRDQRSVERYTHDLPDAERRRAPSPMSVVKRPIDSRTRIQLARRIA
jgi:integrase